MKKTALLDRGTPPLICPRCYSSQVLYRKRDRIYWCRRCGNEWSRTKGALTKRGAR